MKNCYRSLVSLLLITVGALNPYTVFADGSKDLYPEGVVGYRASLYTGGGSPSYPFPSPGTHYVYVQAGETITLASSSLSATATRFRLYDPSGNEVALTVAGTDGRITDRDAELAGPATPGMPANGDEYIPVHYPVTETGIYRVSFTGYGVSEAGPADGNWATGTSTYLAAWDVSVYHSGVGFIPGRVYTNVLNLGLSGNNYAYGFYGLLYALTKDGYTYRVNANGMAGALFTFFVNNNGFTNAETHQPVYKSLNTTDLPTIVDQGYQIHNPNDEDTETNITHKLFYTLPAEDLPGGEAVIGAVPGGTTWLRNEVVRPEVSDVQLIGVDGTIGQVSNKGGIISFIADAQGQYTIVIESTTANPADPNYFVTRALTGTSIIGTNKVAWDGKDGGGIALPPGNVPATITVRMQGAEVHFPYFDVENNLNGIIIERLNPDDLTEALSDIVYWNDSEVTTLAGAPNPKVNSHLSATDNEGRHSSDNGHIFSNLYGNQKSIDTWTFIKGEEVVVPTIIQVNESDLEVERIISDLSDPVSVGMDWTYTNDIRNNGPSAVATNIDPDNGPITQGAVFRLYVPDGVTISTLPSDISFNGDAGVEIVGNPTFIDGVFEAIVDMPAGSGATISVKATVTGAVSTYNGTIYTWSTILRPDDYTDINATNPELDIPPTDPFYEAQGIREEYGDIAGDDPTSIDLTQTNNIKLNGQLSMVADLSIEKSVSAADLNIGAPVTFTLTAANNGPSDAVGTVVTDLLPDGYTFVSADGNYDDETGEWTIGQLAAGDEATLTMVAEITDIDDYTNVATISSDVFDDDPDNNEDEAEITGTPQPAVADLAIEKTVDNDRPAVGGEVTFTVTVTNNGPSRATDVRVEELKPAGYTFTAVSVDAGTWDDDELRWNIPSLASGESLAMAITATVLESNDFVNYVDVIIDGGQTDPNPDNNRGTAAVELLAPELTLIKAASFNGPVRLGDQISYTFEVTNTGNVTMDNIVVSDGLLGGIIPNTVLASGSSWPSAEGTLAPGESVTLMGGSHTVTETDMANGSVTNIAEVRGDDPTGTPTTVPSNEVFVSLIDNCDPAQGAIDSDGDGIGDLCDLDDDNDGILDVDECPITFSPFIYANTDKGELIKYNTITNEYETVVSGLTLRGYNIIGDIAMDRDGNMWGITAEGKLIKIDLSDGSMSDVADVGVVNATSLSFLPDGNLLAGGYDATIRKIDVVGGTYAVSQWADLGTGFANGDFIVIGNKMYILWFNAAIDATYPVLMEMTIDEHLDPATTPVVLGTLPRFTWGLAKANGAQLYGVTGQGTDGPENPMSTIVRIDLTDGGLSTKPVFSYHQLMYGATSPDESILECDTDGDGIPDRLDLDSDNDGCPDAVEYYGGLDPAIGTEVNPDGTLVDATYDGDHTQVVVPTQLTIATPPVDVPAYVGTDAVFSAGIEATQTDVFEEGQPDYEAPSAQDVSAGLVYQWQESADGGNTWIDLTDGDDYTGVTTDELTVVGITLSQKDNQYRIVVTHADLVCAELSTPVSLLMSSLSLVKTAVYTGDPDRAEVGDQIAYTFTVTNTGNVTMEGVAVTDVAAEFTGENDISTLMFDTSSEDSDEGTLLPGEAATYTATYTITQHDINQGGVANVATVTGTSPDGPTDPMIPVESVPGDPEDPTTPLDPDDEPGTPTVTEIPTVPSLSLVKAANVDAGTDGVVNADDVVTYTFTVTNTGNVTMTGVKVSDVADDFTGEGLFPALTFMGNSGTSAEGTLVPGEVATYEAEYTLTLADVNQGGVENVAMVVGTPPTTDPDNPAGPITPEESVPGDPENPTDPLDPADNPGTPTVVDIPEAPSFTLVKATSVDAGTDGVVNTGDVVTYTFTVTNTGNVTMDKVTVSDGNGFTGENPFPAVAFVENSGVGSEAPSAEGTLVPGESATYTATYTLTLADINQGGVDNVATVTGTTPGNPDTPITPEESVPGNPEDPTEPLDPTDEPGEPTVIDIPEVPSFTLVKAATVDAGEDGMINEGDVVTYTFTVTNTGNVTMNNIALSDAPDDFTGEGAISTPMFVNSSGNSTEGILVPGESATYTATYILTLNDVNQGGVDNVATVTGTTPGNPDTPITPEESVPGNPEDPATPLHPDEDPGTPTVVEVPAEPALSLTKRAANEGPYEVGDYIEYEIIVRNTGNITMSDIVVTDDNADIVSGSPIATLDPNAEAVVTARHEVTQADINAGQVVNQAIVTGKDPNDDPIGETPSDNPDTPDKPNDPTLVEMTQEPELTLIKRATSEGPYEVGEYIEYEIIATNSGNVTLTNVTVEDDNAEITDGSPVAILAPGKSATVYARHEVTQEDIDAGIIINQATVTGDDPNGDPIGETPSDNPDTPDQPNDPTLVELTQRPALSLTKRATDEGPYEVGDVIDYELVVRNTGNVTLTNVEVEDNNAVITGGSPIASLAPGKSTTVYARHEVTQADIDAGVVVNSATVSGDDPEGNPTPDVPSDNPDTPEPNDPTVVELTQQPALGLTKRTTGEGPYALGDFIDYELIVRNTGNVTLTSVAVEDDNAVITGGSPIASLAPGKSATVYARHEVTQADIDAGIVLNQATATGDDPNGDPTPEVPSDDPDTPEPNDPTEVDLTQRPALSLTKRATDEGPYAVGDFIDYELTVRNTGNVTLTQVEVTDANAVVTGGSPIASLAPGKSATVFARHQVTQADIDAGNVANQATVRGNDPEGNPTPDVPSDDPATPEPGDPTVVDMEPRPQLTLTKGVTSEGPYDVGDHIRYFNIVVTNTGNVTLTNVTVADDNAEIISGSPIASLAPGRSATVMARHVVTQADMDAGEVINQARVHGDDPQGNQTPDFLSDDPDTPEPGDKTITSVAQTPKIRITKTADKELVQQAGDRIVYQLQVTNTGNVTLTDVEVQDPLTGFVEQIAQIRPGATHTHTFRTRYTVTNDDLVAGKIVNTATVAAHDPEGNVVHNEASHEVDVYYREIDAEDDDFGPVNGKAGGNAGNVFDNDKVNGEPLVPEEVILTRLPSNDPSPLELNPDGTVTVVPNTPAGTYTLDYQVCDLINPDNCDVATVTVVVAPAGIEAADDHVTGVNGYDGTRGVTNVFGNDLLDGVPVVPEDVTLTKVSGDPALKLNPDGTVDVLPGTRGGTYTLEYRICEVLNPNNCSTATVTVTVVNPLKIPNVFTPNGDGQNDRFEIIGLEGFDHVEILIFNRWGNEVYRSDNYRNDWEGRDLTEGTYYYLITTHLGRTQEVHKGWVLIKRN